MNPLRSLDAALVPSTARVLRGTTDAMHAAPRRAARALGALDHRFARGGVLGFVRDLPQLGFVAIGALLVAAALGAVRVDATAAPGPAPNTARAVTPIAGCASGTADPSGGAYVGPSDSAAVPAYVDSQRRLLAACTAAAPGQPALAVVSLTRASTPDDAAAALRGVTADTAYVVLDGQDATPYALALTGGHGDAAAVAASISAAYAAAQAQFEEDRRLQLSQADSIEVTNPTEAAGKAAFVAQADADALAAGRLRDQCACVYGALVSGPIHTLAALPAGAVRVVALAPAGAVAAKVVARPLLPTETTTLSTAAAPAVPEAGDL